MRGQIWALAVAMILLAACAQEPEPEIVYSEVAVPAPENDPEVLQDLIAAGPASFIFFYLGVRSLEETILGWDVIARVSLLGTRSYMIKRPTSTPDPLQDSWSAVLEFRFEVHEYLKGSGADEIVGSVYLDFDWEDLAQAAVAKIARAHDSRWDDREAIVFLDTTDGRLNSLPGQYWFGYMGLGTTDTGIGDMYTVASIHQKLWLPEATQPNPSGGSGGVSRSAPSSSNKMFLLDVPATTTASGSTTRSAASGAATVTAPTISLSNLKAKITALEAEANAGGTAEYRKCVEAAYSGLRLITYSLSTESSPFHVRDLDVASGQPAGTFLWDHFSYLGLSSPARTGRTWFGGPDNEVVRYRDTNVREYPEGTTFTRRYETARPLPSGGYSFYENWVSALHDVCDKDWPILHNHLLVNLNVTPSTSALHEAFFDPVDIGTAVGADSSNGVLEPNAFSLDGATTTISSLKWEDGAVTMTLNPTASLADYAIDFIDVNGTTTLSLTSDNASTTALAWTVPDKPWSDGDLLMLRIHKPISNDATLSALALSGVDLTFSPATTTYAASVPATTTQTTVTPTTNHDDATYVVKLGGVVDDDGTIPLAAGANVVSVEVTAEDGVTTQTYSVTITRAAPSEPITVTLSPRVEGSLTRVNITIEWNDPQPCDGRYMVALYTSSDYFVQLLGFRTASETPSLTTESPTDWDLSRFPDWFSGVSCHPSGLSAQTRELGRVSLRAAHPDNN